MIVHVVDGTYELFRHFYGLRRFNKGKDRPLGAVSGVLQTVIQMLEQGATHVGVATDHVIESFRNGLWKDYKTGEGIEPALSAQFHPLEKALASAARIASEDTRVDKVCIWTVDKDLAQCVLDDRVVQAHRIAKTILDAEGVRRKFGVAPALIPDFLALVGDAADGYPGISGIGSVSAARLLNRYGAIEAFPPAVLGERRDLALLFKKLATLQTDAPLFRDVEELRWRGPTPSFATWAERMEAPRLLERCHKLAVQLNGE
jgi:5'-3' exonuclease